MQEPAIDIEPLNVSAPKVWIARLSLANFRNYSAVTIEVRDRPVVLWGANGAGKTNLLEAVSLLTPGQGLRRVSFPEISRHAGAGDWAVAARVWSDGDAFEIGTGLRPAAGERERPGRIVRIDGVTQSGSGALADIIDVAWLTPASDGLFTGPASERRRFLDRLVLCFDPEHSRRANTYERAMRQRNRLLDDNVREASQFEGLEKVMAEAGVAMAAARREAVIALSLVAERRRNRVPDSPFPWAITRLEGWVEEALQSRPAIDVEDMFTEELGRTRERDRAAKRTLTGPHRTDFLVTHGPKSMPGKLCSTGEQKSLLIGLVLAHAEMSAVRREGRAPVLLLDEIAAHLDADRRAALFKELLLLGAQAWMTGTDRSAFEGLENQADFFRLEDGRIERT